MNPEISDRAAVRRRPLHVVLHAFALSLALLAQTGCVPAIPVAPSVQPTPVGTSQWQVEPGDVIRLKVWGNEGYSGDLMVSDRGEALVPTLGRINVLLLTPAAVEARILRGYAGRIDSTKVEVTFLRPVSVVGGVRTPGVQLTDPSQSVLALVSKAGGPVRQGGDLRVFLLRIGQPTREVSTGDRVSDLGIRSSDQLYVQDPAFIVRNAVAVQTVTQGLALIGTVVTLILFKR